MRTSQPRHSKGTSTHYRGLCATLATLGVVAACVIGAQAANNSIQGGQKKEQGGFDIQAPYAILIEAESGSVLFEKNADQLTAPSSMLKLMTAEVVFNELKKGTIKPTDEYAVSEYAWRKGGAPSGGSTMFAALKSQIKVEDLLRGLAVQSGNDACIILAEGIAGSEGAFTDMMTKRARELGLTQSTFGNSSGVSDPDNKMSVRELAKLALHLIKNRPEFYPMFSEREFTWNKIRQTNRNPLLNVMQGADGLKTGHTKEGGYGMVASVLRKDLRLIAVVNGLDDQDARLNETKKLLEWGFRSFEMRTLFGAGQAVSEAKVFGGAHSSVGLASPNPVRLMVNRNGSEKIIARIVYTGPVRAPVQAGQRIGVVKVWRGDIMVLETPLYAETSIAEGTMTQTAFDAAGEMVLGLLRTGVEKALAREPKAPTAQ
ncbi:D-alanyl-D-alanine carboxypeptidase family protein [Bradyrhizobium sp. LHD-71]|uniref:D-alanyl-D-alanine carboxypeptidase family protein n=1 Tax=Bradyrhizobium sp. LHD-71 TaxID=3072141 RepID=UPI0028108184|nr:D-alanyl-D-alanine carboxypeptidase family protein [Bradyrhizobium sp. LHD-71]MDQ8730041.1 D-alanyl-D-alanine carboxypeptidase family protein [Bradyrhizobium sp. LHD-71]